MKRFFLFHDKWLDYLFVVAINVSHNTQSSDIDINFFSFMNAPHGTEYFYSLLIRKSFFLEFFLLLKIDDLNWH